MFPGRSEYLIDAYNQSTEVPFGYLLIDCHPLTPGTRRLRTAITDVKKILLYNVSYVCNCLFISESIEFDFRTQTAMSECIEAAVRELLVIEKAKNTKLIFGILRNGSKELIFAFGEIFFNILEILLSKDVSNRLKRKIRSVRIISAKHTSVKQKCLHLLKLVKDDLLRTVVEAVLKCIYYVR